MSVWKEKERIGKEQVEAGVIILGTSGCSHFHAGGCSMCGYNLDPRAGVTSADIGAQFAKAVDQLGEVKFLKVYTSGSFLDDHEVPGECADEVLRYCADHGSRLLFETRPEFVTEARLDHLFKMHDKLEIALGLESSNDAVLKYSINKGFSKDDYERAADLIRGRGAGLRTYVLLKPPYLTEAEAVADAVSTMRFASKFGGTISLNPVSVHKGTIVEKMWKTWSYRPPWLWSVLEVLNATRDLGARIICDPTGGGKHRGAHNCGECDGGILDSVRAYSLSQDPSRLGWPDCGCRGQWQSIMEIEQFIAGDTSDLQRFFRRRA